MSYGVAVAFQAMSKEFDSLIPLQIKKRGIIMGMDITASVCIGAVVESEESNVNRKFIEDNEEMLEKEYEGYFSEYLYTKFDNEETSVDFAGSDAYRETLIILKDTAFSVDWTSMILPINSFNVEEKTKELKKILDKSGIEYEHCGLLLYPYCSY